MNNTTTKQRKEKGITFYADEILKDKMKTAQSITGVNWSYELRKFIDSRSDELIKTADVKKAA